jgi:predicted RNA binding protein YcfA (HicA-like mRNA interferase family)
MLRVRLSRLSAVPFGRQEILPPGDDAVKVREITRLLEEDGWQLVRTRGSHRQFRHTSKPWTVTVAGKEGIDLPAGTLASILKQAGLKR